MPSFKCPDCKESFDSREARKDHREDAHDSSTDPLPKRLLAAFQDRKKLGALIFGLFMVGLPLGGVAFYSNLAPDRGASNDGGSTYTQTPPVGQGIQTIPSSDGLPTQTILSEGLTEDEQVQILVQGGPSSIQLQGGTTVSPAALVQYSCTDCPATVQQLESFVQDMNGGQNWVYMAPNTEMDQRIAISVFYGITRGQPSADFEAANSTEMKDFVCRAFAQVEQPVSCVEDLF